MFHIKQALVFVLLTACLGSAQTSLDKTSVQAVIDTLTQSPREVWLSQGTLKVTRTAYQAPRVTTESQIQSQIQQDLKDYDNNPDKPEQAPEWQTVRRDAIPFNTRYDLSNESTTQTTETIQVSGDKFYREVTILYRSDSVQPEANPQQRLSLHIPDVDANRDRAFVYDGQKLTRYYRSVNTAVVEDGQKASHLPRALSVGLIPWGYGIYTRKGLMAGQPTARQEVVNGQQQVTLNVETESGIQVTAVLDPAKAYALLSSRITLPNGLVISAALSDYVSVKGTWVPGQVTEERLFPENGGYRLLGSDAWTLTVVSTSAPSASTFQVAFQNQASIQYFSPLSRSAQRYYARNTRDMEDLLIRRLNVLASKDLVAQNCATVTLQYAAEKLGKNIPQHRLRTLIDASGKSDLLAMQTLLRQNGLYCNVVKTDLGGLAGYEDCQVVLYLSGRKHFVLLDSMDPDQVWTVDLYSPTFYKPMAARFFPMEWTDGVALLVSDRPLSLHDPVVPDDRAAEIQGGVGYACTLLLQRYELRDCPDPSLYGCPGSYLYIYHELWGCYTAPSGYCDDSQELIDFERLPCITMPNNPAVCDYDFDHYIYLSGWGCDGTPVEE